MVASVFEYFGRLGRQFGDGWNRFWFLPSDPYGLGLIRLCVGTLAAYFHLTLAPDLVKFYGPNGWLPVELVEQLTLRGSHFSYLNGITSPNALYAVHVAGMVVLLLFAVGYCSRLTSILALVVILSDVHRGPMLTSQFEPVLTMVMCYLCIGPSGASWSLDKLLARRKAATPLAKARLSAPEESVSATVALRLIQVHLAMFVAMMAVSKLWNEVWWNGMASWWLATRPESRLVDLTFLTPYPLNFWSHVIVAFEFAFPVLIWVRVARPLMLGLAVLIWGSLALVTGQVTFVLALIVASLSYCSAEWLRSVTRADGDAAARTATAA